MDIGENIKKLRSDKGISLRGLALKAHISSSTLSEIENGKTNPSIKTLQNIAEALNIDVNLLLKRTDKISLSAEEKQALQDSVPPEYAQKYKVIRRDLNQLKKVTDEASIFFMDDTIADEDKDQLMRDLQEMFWMAKEKNKEKYGRKKK